MKFKSLLVSVLGFRTIPTTVAVVLIYAAIFISIYVTDQLPAAPTNQRGLNLTEAYADLQQITRHPHPYNSHANTRVRSYLLSRLSSLTQKYPHVHLADDLTSNGSWASSASSAGVYFEGTNLLLRIDGTDPDPALGGVLFSAHYDSVSTAPGATDDGMGVVTLLQIAQVVARERTRRTVVLNVNNGEEDWLNGAHAFLEHPWSNLTTTFINLEGAASGGRPLLFRATSLPTLRSFRPPNVPHPHANVLSADAFARGVVRSGTDYTVYTAGDGGDDDWDENLQGSKGGRKRMGMDGLDLAFYKGRSLYHTRFDGTPWTEGSERSLWAMMEAARGAGVGMANAPPSSPSSSEEETPVYFDLFASTLLLLPLRTLLTTNILLLLLGPIVLFLLLAIEHIAQREHQSRSRPQNGSVHGDEAGIFAQAWAWFIAFGWFPAFWQRAKFWLALLVAGAVQAGVVVGYVKLNPFIVYSAPYTVLLTSFSLVFLCLFFILRLPSFSPTSKFKAATQHNHSETRRVMHQTYALTYLLLLPATLLLAKVGVGGVYVVSAWNACAGAGCVLEGLGGVWSAWRGGRDGGRDGERRERVVRFEETERGEGPEEGEHAPGQGQEEEVRHDANERTPLIPPSSTSTTPSTHNPSSSFKHSEHEDPTPIGWWLLPLLLTVPLPVILVGHIANLMLDAMAQTLADGSAAGVVYTAISLLSLLLLLPLAPFMHKLHPSLAYAFLLVGVLGTAWSWVVFPFDQGAPLKVFFQQKIDLEGVSVNISSAFSASNYSVDMATPRVVTALTGSQYYLEHLLVPSLPSARGKEVKCHPESAKLGLHTCEWESGQGMDAYPGGDDPFSISRPGTHPKQGKNPVTWLRANLTRTSRTSAHISLQGRNTRSCRIYLTNRAITSYSVSGSGQGKHVQEGFEIGDEGVREVRLWSRGWGRRWGVDVEWKESGDGDGVNGVDEGKLKGNEDKVEGRVACEWVEYESAMVDNGLRGGGGGGAKIPALEEVLAFLPSWAVVSKMTDGLVEVSSAFVI